MRGVYSRPAPSLLPRCSHQRRSCLRFVDPRGHERFGAEPFGLRSARRSGPSPPVLSFPPWGPGPVPRDQGLGGIPQGGCAEHAPHFSRSLPRGEPRTASRRVRRRGNVGAESSQLPGDSERGRWKAGLWPMANDRAGLPQQRMQGLACWGYIGISLALIGAYIAMTGHGLTQSIIYVCSNLAAAVAILMGIRLHRPNRRKGGTGSPLDRPPSWPAT